ncbi:MAG: hypothetical protein V7785_23385 [Bermanella sp.]
MKIVAVAMLILIGLLMALLGLALTIFPFLESDDKAIKIIFGLFITATGIYLIKEGVKGDTSQLATSIQGFLSGYF